MMPRWNFGGGERVRSARAANNHIRLFHGLIRFTFGNRANIAFCGKLWGAARTGVNPYVFASAFTQGCNSSTRVGTRSEDESTAGFPVFLSDRICQIEGDRDD